MPRVSIRSYEVTLRDDTTNRFLPILILKPDPSPGISIDRIVMTFYTNPADVGFQTPTQVFHSSPLSTFRDYYEMLKTEKPIYFEWGADSNDRLTFAVLTTGSEPLGEGVDTSP
jgi:hypothetical protein